MFSDLSNHRWNVSTIGIDGTVVLGASFIFLAYVLTPAIESAYQNVRASRAWRAIEEGQEVEVTDYPMATEVFGGRGKWDSARVVTVLLAVFSLASWGLELSMDLAYYEGSADLLNRPPPVTLGKRNGSPVWQVKTQEELGYKQPWRDLPNVFQGHANSRYYLNNGNFEHRYIDGGIVAALWFNNTDDKRFELHYQDRIMATMNDLRCAKDETDKRMDVYIGNSKWGTVVQCESGPTVTLKSASEATGTRTENAPPTIIITSSDELFLIVEENSSHPSFLYSVWTYRSKHDDEVELHHVFHMATSMRLAEAVVTGIVHGERTGGGCFGLLRRFSEGEGFYDIGIM